MFRTVLSVVVGLALAVVAEAQSPNVRFRWQRGQVLAYRVEHSTKASEIAGGKTTETSSKLANIKRWQVIDVDGDGVATVQLSLAALRVQTTTPAGETLMFDSAKPEESNQRMREQLGKYVGSVLAVLRVDGRGKVLEVKSCSFGPASRFESELPFVIELPEAGPTPGQEWQRNYLATLEPPQGAGEKFEATQRYMCKGRDQATAAIAFTTSLKTPMDQPDQAPLFQMLPDGEVIFDLENGRLRSAHVKIDKELKGHLGEGTSYRFQSDYVEEYMGDK